MNATNGTDFLAGLDTECGSSIIAAAVSGALLLLSEVLPYIQGTESNGLLHFLSTTASKLLNGRGSNVEPRR